jgi:hypothetical protein
MNWTSVISLIGPTGPSGPQIKTGKYTVGESTTITFDSAFLDTNYIVLLTPYVSSEPSGVPMAWVSGVTNASFVLNLSGADGVYWLATSMTSTP